MDSEVFFLSKQFSDKMEKQVNIQVKDNSIQSIHREGFITALPNGTETRYSVSIDGDIYKIPAREGLNLAVNNIVIIISYNGDFSKNSWIDLKRPW